MQTLYEGKLYDEIYKQERDEITLEYKDAFERNRKLTSSKIEEILSLLLEDYIFDEMLIYDLNPGIKLYDEPEKYAEFITSYSLRFINSRTNRLEIFERTADVRRLGKDVVSGVSSNDPYIKLNQRLKVTNFPLKRTTYYWVNKNGRGQQEIGIYTALKEYHEESYVEYRMHTPQMTQVITEVAKLLRRTCQVDADYTEFVGELIRSLNIELVTPPISVLRNEYENMQDQIIPLTYRYRFYTNPQEFEDKLYVSIEDNIGRDYKYKISETVLEDLTRIGTKLAYTDENGEFIRRQSIADFNVNGPTAVITKETIIDQRGIENLLGYIYDDIEDKETDVLPVPSTYVDIYVPKDSTGSVSMYNGTSLEFTLDSVKDKGMYFNSTNAAMANDKLLPGATYVVVRYLNSKNEVLKENKIGNVFPGSTYTPEILPIINDANGREWRSESTRVDPFVISQEVERNVIDLKYVERYARVTFSFINREGKKIAEDKQEIVQVGETYDFESKKKIVADDNDEWTLKFTRPSKVVVKDDEEKNKVILVYDIEKTDVRIKFMNKSSMSELIESKFVTVPANKKYVADVPKMIIDKDGFAWRFVEGGDVSIIPQMEEENVITLYYTEAKVPVTVRVVNEEKIKLIDDVVELVQIGKTYAHEFDAQITDFECKHWQAKSENKRKEIIVNQDKNKNVLEGVYEPQLASIMIKFLNTEGRAIKSDEIVKAQIGSIYDKDSLDEIIDNYGKAWRCTSKADKMIVKSQEIENQFTLLYEPLMGKITIKYLDSEQNELMPSKTDTMQVGSTYKTRPIEKFTSQDGKYWKIDPDKVESIVVRKFEEENIYSIYYEPQKANVQLRFFDAYNNELRDAQMIEHQIGAPLVVKMFEKITDNKGQRWMLETSEPKNLIVKEKDNYVKLIYDEIKAKVLVKFVNVKTGKTIIDNLVTTVKLGGIYVPNIQQNILDQNKWHWKYVGDQNISIVTKENEQENIIVLNYEENTAKVILKYVDLKKQTIREDAIKDVQIGKELRIEPLQKLTDANGLMWKYNSTKIDNKVVKEGDNIVYGIYEPLMTEIRLKYINDVGENIKEDFVTQLQVGKQFVPEVIERLNDSQKKLWGYDTISAESIIAQEDKNEIYMKFKKMFQTVTVQLVDEEGSLIAHPTSEEVQIGDIFVPKYENAYKDAEEKEWVFAKVDKPELQVNEDVVLNTIKVYYKKDMADVTLFFFSILREEIKEKEVVQAQIGSIYTLTPPKEIIDQKTNLGWKLPNDYHETHKIKRNPDENLIEVHYEQLKVKVIVQFKDGNGESIIKDSLYSEQVGTTFTPKVDKVLVDLEGKEWLFGSEESIGLLGVSIKTTVEALTVLREDEKNVIKLPYRKSLEKVIIKYQEPLGNSVKKDEEVQAQVGSIYEAEAIDVIEDAHKVKWVYNPNSNPTVKVSHEVKDNVIILAYEEEKAMVTYKYQDEDGNRIRSPKRKLVQIGSSYEPEIENVIEDFKGKMWEFKAQSVDKIDVSDDENANIIQVVYMPLNVDVVLRLVNKQGKQIVEDQIVKAQLGSEYSPKPEAKVTDEESRLFQYVKCEPESIKIVEKKLGALESPNVFELTYEPVFTEAVVMFKTVDGEVIKEAEKTELQVGSIFNPVVAQYVKDENGIQWELASKDIEPVRLKEDIRENTVTLIYEVAKAEVTVRYKNLDGAIIKKADIFSLKVGEEFIPEVQKELVDEEGKKWLFSVAEPIKLTVGSINNIINLIYQEKKVNVIVKIQSKDGKTLKEDQRLKIQVGSRFEPKNTTKVIYNADEIWRFTHNDPSSIIVSENVSENVIVQCYSMEERQEVKQETSGTYYNPDVEKFIDKDLVAEEEAKEKEEAAKRVELEKQKEMTISFEDEKLKPLEKQIALTNNEKKTIIDMNQINTVVISRLNEELSKDGGVDEVALEDFLNEQVGKEKQYIQDGLIKLIEDDKTGKNILKIFESITSSEAFDKNFNLLNQRKTILIADYFINKKVTDEEQASYICEKGIIDQKIDCINEKLSLPVNPKDKNRPMVDKELNREKILAVYERVLIEQYNKARSIAKDDFFKNPDSRSQITPNVSILVTNMLPQRAFKLAQKIDNLSQEKEIELLALLRMMSPQQFGTFTSMVEKIPDGKLRKVATKKIKEMTEGK